MKIRVYKTESSENKVEISKKMILLMSEFEDSTTKVETKKWFQNKIVGIYCTLCSRNNAENV